jgi:peptide/nickel transport system permease protein
LFERAKGVSAPRLVVHTLRNASLPIVTLAGILLGSLISGAVVVETIFAWPGVGQLAIQGINSRDYNVVQGVVLVNTAIFVGLLFLVDVSYGLLDPRVRRHSRGVAP